MSLQDTPSANRLHITLLGRCNSGKSSLINALTGQDTALVSPTPGTTTDPVNKAMELPEIGPCVLIDTAGFDDEGTLGELRITRTRKALERTDVALLLCNGNGDWDMEQTWLQQLAEKHIPVVLILSKADTVLHIEATLERMEQQLGERPLPVSNTQRTGLDAVRRMILQKLPEDFGRQSITGNLVQAGDLVLLVMPQDAQAPKGRLILPQVQTLRELLDKQCLVMSCTTDGFSAAVQALAQPPRLIITDSQAFHTVYQQKPTASLLTSFSVLMAGYKGDIPYYIEGAAAIDRLTPQSRVLIAEACTHAPLTEDIGRVKLPRLLRKRVGDSLQIDIVSGTDFPDALNGYDLVIHCGACMFNRKYVLSRITQARQQHIPMTNYGIAIAHLNGILDKIVY